MRFQHLATVGRRGIALAAKPGESLHLPDGHAGFAQAQQESDPLQVRGRVAPLAAACTRNRCDQARTLVVTKRVGSQAGAFGDFGNGQMGCHGKNPKSWSAL